MGDDSFGEIRLEFFAVEVFLRTMARTEVVDERADGDVLGFEPGPVLDECSEGSGTSGGKTIAYVSERPCRGGGIDSYPVPKPAMMIGCMLSGGNFMTLGLIETVTF